MPARLETVLQDARYAFRGLRRSPAFTITVILTLGLGIGANTAMFGIVDRLMFKPFPYMRDPASVNRVYLRETFRGQEFTGGVSQYTRYLDLRKFTTTFSQYAPFTTRTLAVGSGTAARERQVGVVGATFFDFFDAKPAIGRFFVAAEDTTPRGAEVALLSYEFWQSEFGGRDDVLGEVLQINNVPSTIVGVTPKGFVGIFDGNPPVAYLPITTYAGSSPGEADRTTYFTRYNWGWMDMMVRRSADVSVESASADLTQAYMKSWAAQTAQEPRNTPAEIARPRAFAGALKTAAGPDPSVEAKTVRWVGGIAIIVLLIACSNVANLFLSRALRRRRETAVRIALGVARSRLVAQWFTESLMLALVGCAAGVLIAQWGGAALRQLFVGDGAAIPVATDWRTLGVSAGLAIVAAVLTGLAPILVSGRSGIAGDLKAGAREGTHGRSRLRSGLLILQMTMSVVLLVGAGLFVKSFSHVRSMRLGFDSDPAVLVSRNLRGTSLPDTQLISLNQRLLETTQAQPGVEHAAVVSSVPFWSTSSTQLFVAGIDSVRRLGRFSYQTATPDYFAAMGTQIIRGRPFADTDRAGTGNVAVVSAAMAAVLWPCQDAIGKQMRVGSDTAEYTTIVGIAEDAAQQELNGDDRFRYYMPMNQYRAERGSYLIARVRGDPALAGETIRKALQPLMPGQSYITTRPLRDLISSQQRAWRFGATMFVAFGGLALVVAAIGLYGVIGYNVAQRMHELGVRVALGAQTGDLTRLVMRQGLQVALIGIAAGTAVALALSSQVQPLLFEQSARDPVVFGIVAAVLLTAALAASTAPARRAAKADPNMALRSD
ncbi:MAG: ABC transporter permease [Gemmatimonadetes bacterium]|nr:ABC transporter permease [Gemmatimonadota bacterium]